MRGHNDWSPNSLEKKCLHDLDSADNWTNILKHARPDESEVQGWSPFWRIYAINAALFLTVLTVIFFTLEFGLAGGFSELHEDLVVGLATVVIIASGLASYVTYLYRRSWNRRARLLLADSEEFS